MNETIILIVLAVSCMLNAIGDIYLLHGVRYTQWQPGLDALSKTGEKHIMWGSLSGLATIPAWFLIVPYLANFEGVAGFVSLLSYCIYVAATFAFHLCYCFVGLSVRKHTDLIKSFEPLVGTIAGYSFVSAIVFSIAWVLFGTNDTITMNWFHWLTTPLVTIVLMQMVLGRLLRKVPYFLVICGPIAMFIFFYGFIDFIRLNPQLQ